MTSTMDLHRKILQNNLKGGNSIIGGGIMGGKIDRKAKAGLKEYNNFAQPLYNKGLSRDQVVDEWKKSGHGKSEEEKRLERRKYGEKYRKEIKDGKRKVVPLDSSAKLKREQARIENKAAKMLIKK
jgi:hypothetical protein